MTSSSSSLLSDMTALRAIGLFYGLIVVVLLSVGFVFRISPRLAMLCLVGVVVFCIYSSLLFQTHSQASIIHKCLAMSQTERATRVQLLLSLLIFPLYPFLGLPLVTLAALQLGRGKCDL